MDKQILYFNLLAKKIGSSKVMKNRKVLIAVGWREAVYINVQITFLWCTSSIIVA